MAVDEIISGMAEAGKACLQAPWELAKILAKKGFGG
jgi:hypothetical protein